MKLNIEPYLKYQLLNNVFLGISVGSIFTVYGSLDPEIFSYGGIALALLTVMIARYYSVIMNERWFYKIMLVVEIAPAFMLVYFLISPFNYTTALMVYIAYQLTFIFGSYLARAETLIFNDNEMLRAIDTYKQYGYMFGMGFAIVFYWVAEFFFGITENKDQVYYIHYVLFAMQLIIIYYFIRTKGGKNNG